MKNTNAAVAIILHEESCLILKRAENPADPWSGHLALPGGRKEIEDTDLVETAIRETKEECGITLLRENLINEIPIHKAGISMNKSTLSIMAI